MLARLTLILSLVTAVVALLGGFRLILYEWRRWRQRRWMNGLLVLVILLTFGPFLPLEAEATNHYIRAGAGGASPCSTSWATACSNVSLPAIRGDTYYFAAGNYTGYTFPDLAGTTDVIFKKATVADHGTATGWLDSYATGQAVWTSAWNLQMSHFVVDGVTGGGPSSWESGHGFKFDFVDVHHIYMVFPGQGGIAVTDFTLKHVEMTNQDTAPGDCDFLYPVAGGSNWTLQYNWLHNCGEDVAQVRGDHSNWLVEYNKFDHIYANGSFHADLLEYDDGTFSNLIFRYNWVDTFDFTYMVGTHESGTLSGAEVYGNLITNGGTNNGVVSALSGGGTITGTKFYNNTLYNIDVGGGAFQAGFGQTGGGSGNVGYNNIWYFTTAFGGNTGMPTTHDYNGFRNAGSFSEAHIQNFTSDPFVNAAGSNWALSAGTDVGNVLASPYNTDMNGVTRGADGTWDRGAIEYTTALPPASTGSYAVLLRSLSGVIQFVGLGASVWSLFCRRRVRQMARRGAECTAHAAILSVAYIRHQTIVVAEHYLERKH